MLKRQKKLNKKFLFTFFGKLQEDIYKSLLISASTPLCNLYLYHVLLFSFYLVPSLIDEFNDFSLTYQNADCTVQLNSTVLI